MSDGKICPWCGLQESEFAIICKDKEEAEWCWLKDDHKLRYGVVNVEDRDLADDAWRKAITSALRSLLSDLSSRGRMAD